MNRLTITLILCLISSLIFAQVPHSFSYQAVVRNSNGEPLAYQLTSFRISLLQGSDVGPTSYQETHLAATNFFGMVNLKIGRGDVIIGAFDTLSWGSNSYFIKVEADISGKNNFTVMGTTQLLSVPYALYAEKAGGGKREADLDWEVIGNDVVTGHGGSYPAGNVGIGNNAPGSLLYVAKNTGEPAITIRNMGGGGGATYSMVDDFSGASWKFKATTFGGFKIRDQANALDVFTIEPNSAANSLYIKTGGNIGIGTTLPAFKLDVSGNVNASGYYKGGIPFLPSGLQDLDGDTRINAEENPDEDIIRFYTGGQEQMRMMDKRMEIINPDRNIFIGEHSGENNAGGIHNVYLGRLAGQNNTTGSYNVILGDSAGRDNSEGYNNVFVGAWSGTLNTTGICNAFFGADAGERNQTGTRNAYLGYGAGYKSTGSRNTFVGSHAGVYNTAGDNNTFVGQAAGYNNSGNLNVFIGKSAGANEGGSNKLYIANSDTSGPLIYGEFDNRKLHFHANTFLIGKSNQILSYSGNVVLGPGAGFTNGQTGSSSQNVYIGQNAGYDDIESDNNVFIGAHSGNKNTRSQGNVFIGAEAGWRNTTGGANTLLGMNAGRLNQTGQGNVFIGYWAGRNEFRSNKLYIANSETAEPLIYGDFAEKRVKMWADNLEVEGKTSSRDGYNVDGDDGIYDTVFMITSFDFASQKIKFRKQVIKGGIIIELTGESAWADSINKQYLFCDDGLTDERDGRSYQTVLIGDQCWMAENLDVGTRIDGTIEQSDNGTIEKYCYYDNETNCSTYGGLYSWNELMQYKTTPGTQGICPKGWHVPTDEEYKILEGTVDSLYKVGNAQWDLFGWRGYNAGKNLKSAVGWGSGNGTDSAGFHAVPGGMLLFGNDFIEDSTSAFFWTSFSDNSRAYFRQLYRDYNTIARDSSNAFVNGYSLRCLKGAGIDLPTVVTAMITNITDTTATGGGNITSDGGAPITSRGVVWSTQENPTLSESSTTDGMGKGTFTSILTGLINDTSYYVRASATNSAGTAYGEQVGFTTRGSPCPGIPYVEWQGTTYSAILVGNQCWLRENLDVGSMIHVGLKQQDNSILEKYCYGNDPENCIKYGGLYQWPEAMQYVTQQGTQGICPPGWHIPRDDEMNVLAGFADSQFDADDALWYNAGFQGFDAGKNLRSIFSWTTNGTDLYGFSQLGSGFAWVGTNFGYLNAYGIMWTSSEIEGANTAWDREIYHSQDGIERWPADKGSFGLSIRCLSDETALPAITTTPVSNITEISATSGGNITDDGGSVVTTHGVVWSTSEYPTLNDNFTTDGAGTGEFISTMTGFTSSTQYYVRAYATNATGTGYGNQIRFTSGGQPCPGTPTVLYDGQTYHTVLIGSQCWLEENLNAGTMIEGINNQTNNDIVEKYCYNDDPNNCLVYGALYQWNEAMQYNTVEGSQGICPEGWHIPTDQELKTLEGTVDTQYGLGDPVWDEAGCRGNDAGTHLKSFSGWPEWCNGDNLSGFNYLHSEGYRQTDGTFIAAEGGSPLWSSSQYNGNSSWPRTFPCYMGGLCRNYDDNRYGWSIRCIKN
ncbi:MAG TPA: FISUMP domain-containing protein [Bacteroidales bacterium]|nr:FISUMP domain-containing protein [Bacteroidales bacterium]